MIYEFRLNWTSKAFRLTGKQIKNESETRLLKGATCDVLMRIVVL